VAALAERLDRRYGWDRMPYWLGEFTLFGLRHRLRQRNLFALAVPEPELNSGETTRSSVVGTRQLDGSYNDLEAPRMGAINTRFGRNTPLLVDDGRGPSADEVSDALLKRHEFIPATSVNQLAAAWIQFEVHDWFSHRVDATLTSPAGRGLDVPRFWRDPDAPDELPSFASGETHWWDGSQLYGTTAEFADSIRVDDGRLLTGDDLLARIQATAAAKVDGDARGAITRKGEANMWTGLALMHVLFAHEHNAIAAALTARYPRWESDRLYVTARLINAAVMAKIHTVEWTPAMIAHPTTARSIRATWFGLLGEGFKRRAGRVGSGEILSGIPGSARNHDGVPYSLTEEFVSVYRMHPLIPDHVHVRDAANPLSDASPVEFRALAATASDPDAPRDWLRKHRDEDMLFSLGTDYPGAITLHNYPEFLRDLTTVNGTRLDLAAVDVLRTRECAVARYCDFRRMFRLPVPREFSDLTGNRTWQAELANVYGNEIERVDLMVGLFAEGKPDGFAFGDTAFRVFLLMAARRLRSDRFFTDAFTADTYTPEGMKWIADASMARLLRRHYPTLSGVLPDDANAFVPWPAAP
jgi:hypothetical protein